MASRTKLAAIMFTDIVGYSAMMDEDEERTISVLKRHNDIVLPLIEASEGEVIDAIGDGLFVLFSGVRDAVSCSLAIHNAVAAYNGDVEPGHRFQLRIGIHLGEVWREQNRAYGNGVNLAARIQPFARPGGICVSADVHDQITHGRSFETRLLGKKSLKNIRRQVDLYEVLTGHEKSEASPGPRGELDAIKERLLEEREKRARRGREQGVDEDSIEKKIENGVFSLVERVMDKAIEKWESMPEEKREEAEIKIREALEKSEDSERSVTISKDSSSNPIQPIVFGTIMGVGFGLGHFLVNIPWMLWPFIILGVLPTFGGLMSLIKNTITRRKARRERPAWIERKILSMARKAGGTLSVVHVASSSGITLAEAQEALDGMAARGYVTQRITDGGSVEYDFPGLFS